MPRKEHGRGYQYQQVEPKDKSVTVELRHMIFFL
jgi:hypothetical protein